MQNFGNDSKNLDTQFAKKKSAKLFEPSFSQEKEAGDKVVQNNKGMSCTCQFKQNMSKSKKRATRHCLIIKHTSLLTSVRRSRSTMCETPARQEKKTKPEPESGSPRQSETFVKASVECEIESDFDGTSELVPPPSSESDDSTLSEDDSDTASENGTEPNTPCESASEPNPEAKIEPNSSPSTDPQETPDYIMKRINLLMQDNGQLRINSTIRREEPEPPLSKVSMDEKILSTLDRLLYSLWCLLVMVFKLFIPI